MLRLRSHSKDAAARPRCWWVLGCLIGLLAGCGGQDAPPANGTRSHTETSGAQIAATPEKPPVARNTRPRRWRPKRNLSEYALFEGDLADLNPTAGVMPYDINTPLFSDYAWKHRVVKLPEGTSAQYTDSGSFQFPIGTIIAKTFYFPVDFNDPSAGRQIVETRILMHRESGWIGVPYVWNAEQSDAVSEVAGEIVEVSWKHTDGTQRSNSYIVPNMNDCKRCHKSSEIFEPIGTQAHHLNKPYPYEQGMENQLAHWTRTGILTGAPANPAHAPRLAIWNDESTGTVDERARAWLETNCAHCHNSRGPARNSGLFLTAGIADPYQLGVYKSPVAAGRGSGGRKYDIVPGKPDESILLFRLESTHPGIAMPEFGRTQVDVEANALIRQWIAQMPVPAGFDISNAIGEFQSLTNEQLQQFVTQVVEEGDPHRGEEIFHRRRLNCFKCHAVGGVGEQVGPDLLETHDERTTTYLVESILLPNKVIRKGFETVTVITDAGLAVSGVLLEETDSELVLRDLTRPEIRIPKETIAERTVGHSLMPTNVVSLLPRRDVIDLVRFLSELGKSDRFRPDNAPVIRRWEVLDPIPKTAANISPEEFVAEITSRRDLIWEPAYSRVNGELALEPLLVTPQSGVRVVRCDFEVIKPGELELQLNSTTGLQLWLDGGLVKKSDQMLFNAKPGRHTLTFLVDLEQRDIKTLRCEISPASTSPAEIHLQNSAVGSAVRTD